MARRRAQSSIRIHPDQLRLRLTRAHHLGVALHGSWPNPNLDQRQNKQNQQQPPHTETPHQSPHPFLRPKSNLNVMQSPQPITDELSYISIKRSSSAKQTKRPLRLKRGNPRPCRTRPNTEPTQVPAPGFGSWVSPFCFFSSPLSRPNPRPQFSTSITIASL